MDLSAPALLKKLDAFRKTEWFTAVLLVVLGVVAVGLFQFTTLGGIGVCAGIILPPVTVFVIPYWLGERRMKRYAWYILPVLLIAALLIAGLQTQAVVTQTRPNLTSGAAPNTPDASLPTVTIWNGTVDPYNTISPNSTYAFHVRVKLAPGLNQSLSSVYLNVSELVGLSESLSYYVMAKDPAKLNDTSNGTWYVSYQSLAPNVYAFQFTASYNQSNWTYSLPVLAPVIAPWTSYYGVWLVSMLEFMIYPGSFYYVILFMYWYTIRARKMRERLIETTRGEKMDLKKGPVKEGEAAPTAGEGAGGTETATETTTKAEPPAPTREKSRKAAAFTCTNCGADVTEDDAKCPKCGAVFED